MAKLASKNHNDKDPNCNCFTCFMGREHRKSVAFEFMLDDPRYDPNFLWTQAIQVPPLEVRVAKDIESLTAGLEDFAGKKELPLNKKKELDLSKYEDALEHLRITCTHDSTHDILWQREWVCDDCDKHFNRTEYTKMIRAKQQGISWIKGWF